MISRILPVILILISIALFVVLVNPIYTGDILPKQAEIKQYNDALAAAADFNTQEAKLETDRNAIPAASIQRLETFLPDGVDNVQLILDLNALAAHSGVQLSNFDIRDGATATTDTSGALPDQSGNKLVDSLSLSVRATGTYSAFRTFLAGVESSLRPLDLIQMSLVDSQTGVYSYSLTFHIYWLH